MPLSPEAFAALKAACQKTNQSAVARRLGLSPSAVSTVLKGTYPGNLANIEQLIRGVLLAEEHFCPAAGFDISADNCARFQRQKWSSANALRSRLVRTCPTCEWNLNNSGEESDGEG